MPKFQPEIVDHRQRAEAWRIAGGTEITVDVVLAEPGIGERAMGAFGMQLEQRLVVGLARRMFKDPDDIGLTLDAHRRLILPFEAKARSGMGYCSARAVNPGLPPCRHRMTECLSRRPAPSCFCKRNTGRNSHLAIATNLC